MPQTSNMSPKLQAGLNTSSDSKKGGMVLKKQRTKMKMRSKKRSMKAKARESVPDWKKTEPLPKWLADYQALFPAAPPAKLTPTPDSFIIPSKSFDIPDFGTQRK
jgi:hypothetical protein